MTDGLRDIWKLAKKLLAPPEPAESELLKVEPGL